MSWDAVNHMLSLGAGFLLIGFLLALISWGVYAVYKWLIHSQKAMTVFFFGVLALFLHSCYADLTEEDFIYWTREPMDQFGEKGRLHLETKKERFAGEWFYSFYDAAYGGTDIESRVYKYQYKDGRTLYLLGASGFYVVQYEPILHITLLAHEHEAEGDLYHINTMREHYGTSVFKLVFDEKELSEADRAMYGNMVGNGLLPDYEELAKISRDRVHWDGKIWSVTH